MGAGPAIAGAGLGMNILGNIQAGKQADKTAQFNAAVAEQDAKAAEDKAEFDEVIHRDRVGKAISTLRARIGKSGVSSPAQALAIEESIEAGEMDALAIRHSGAVEAARARSGGAIERAGGRSARRAGRLRAGASLLSGGASLFKQSNIPAK